MDPLHRKTFDTTLNRRRILREDFGFDCACPVCVAACPEDDALRYKISELERSPLDADSLSRQLTLCQQVGMHPGILLPICLKLISRYKQCTRLDLARCACADAEKYATVAYGPDAVNTQKIKWMCEAAHNEADEMFLTG